MAVASFDSTGADTDTTPVPARSWWALAVLFTVYMLNFLDRTLIFILFAPIQKEMDLNNTQAALLGSTSFVMFYTVLGIPFGRMADRVVRKRMIAVGLLIWSVFSGLTGFMESFTGIFLCRVLVGVGEATLGPAALSLLSDLFPPRARATVGAIYSAGIPVGAGMALLLGGSISQAYGWRWAFYLLGFPGVALAVLVLLLHEPQRGVTEKAAPAQGPPPDWRILVRLKALWLLYTGYAFFAVAGNSLSMWIPKFLIGAHGLPIKDAGFYSGIAATVGGLAGTLSGGWLADRFHRRGPGGRMRFTALAALLCVPLWLVLLFAPSPMVLMVPFTFLMGMALMWLGPAAADVQDVVGPGLRGLGVAVYFFVVNIVGYGIAPPLIGALADALGVKEDPWKMQWALLVCPVSSALAALLLWRGSVEMARMRKAEATAASGR